MPMHIRMKCAFQFYDDNPKNQAVITPCFRHQTWQVGEDPLPADVQALCDDLATKLTNLPGATCPLTVTAYDIERPKPSWPLGSTTRNSTAAPKAITIPPELTVVLSFNDGHNVPRHRGRLYLPAWLVGATKGDLDEKIGSALRTPVVSLVGDLANVGGGNVDWGVWSSVDRAFHKASAYFISDAWATVRSRGIKETSRTTGSTSG